MVTDNAKLNGILLNELGISLRNGSLTELLKYPGLKECIINESTEIHGVEIEAADPKVKERNVSIFFYLKGRNEEDFYVKYEALQNILIKGIKLRKDENEIDSSICELSFPNLKKCFRLKYMDCQNYGVFSNQGALMELRFLEANPMNRSI